MSEYTFVDYEKLNRHVIDYQNDVPGSAEHIVKAFNGFIWKFVELVCDGKFKIEDTTTRNFVALYHKNKTYVKLSNQYKYKPIIKDALYESSQRVKKLFSQYNAVEVKNEAVCTLLHMAKIYEDNDKPSFHNYIDKCFHFWFYRNLNNMISDPVARMNYESYIDNMSEDTSSVLEFEEAVERAEQHISIERTSLPSIPPSDPYSDKSIDINWINGITCSDVFKDLTPFDRNIFKMYYVDKMNDQDIADHFGMCRATINRKRLKAKEKLSL